MRQLLALLIVGAVCLLACGDDSSSDGNPESCVDGVACDDGNACTRDTCELERCVHTEVVVDDGDRCTVDTCDVDVGVIHTATPIDDGNGCTDDRCDPATGEVTHVPTATDDGNACTDDVCAPATGEVSHVATPTDDGNACTDDVCDPATGEVSHEDTTDDLDPCTVDACDPATGVSHTPVSCLVFTGWDSIDGGGVWDEVDIDFAVAPQIDGATPTVAAFGIRVADQSNYAVGYELRYPVGVEEHAMSPDAWTGTFTQPTSLIYPPWGGNQPASYYQSNRVRLRLAVRDPGAFWVQAMIYYEDPWGPIVQDGQAFTVP